MTRVKMERQGNDHLHIIYICMIPVLQTNISVYLRCYKNFLFQNPFDGMIDGDRCDIEQVSYLPRSHPYLIIWNYDGIVVVIYDSSFHTHYFYLSDILLAVSRFFVLIKSA